MEITFFFFFTFKYGVWKFWDHTAKSFYRSLQYICLVNTTYCGLILNNWVDVSTVHGDWRPDVKCKLVLASHKVTCIWLQVGLLYMNAWRKALNKCKHKILVNIIFCGIIINGWNPRDHIPLCSFSCFYQSICLSFSLKLDIHQSVCYFKVLVYVNIIYCIEALLYTDANYFGIVINRKHMFYRLELSWF